MPRGFPRRTSAQQQEPMPAIEVGDVDPMSEMRTRMGAPACSSESDTGRFCTRIVGHDEIDRRANRAHPAGRHVHVGPDNTAWEIW